MAIEELEGKDTNVSSRKGVFIPDITVEMFRNASLEGVEGLMESGEMEDISLPSAKPEITDRQAIEQLQESGWMQNHDKQMYEMGLREQLADDSDSYDAPLPSAQPIISCDGCRFVGTYDTDFPCRCCIRREKDYYELGGVCIALDTIEDLPPAQPERKRGFWWAIEKGEKGYSAGNFRCSVCGEPNVSYISKPNFCPNCGADMRGKLNERSD